MAKAIMIQGTMSNAGKSLLTTGLCRIFRQDGYRTAPFKAQNMALNSFITRDGLEMGRAQAVQAQAAGVEPSVLMNPVLLKPSSDTGSQVIVNGIPIGTMAAKAYFQYKTRLLPEIRAAYEALEQDYDIIVIEGAGSPAEINLKKDDIVNMGMARLARAPVLLAGDIDRGGVFAQLYGTVMLLEPEERAMIKAMIINKFRGDRSILEPGVRMIQARLSLPVIGVTPYLSVDIEDEDSLSTRLEAHSDQGKEMADIAVIRFPRLSNFTDFGAFERIPGVRVRYVGRPDQLGTPDLVILPGTKNTIDDLLWLRQCGLEAAVLKLASKDVPVFGICGGYQMMGRLLLDELGTESGRKETRVRGMGFFSLHTVFEEKKTRTRVNGRFLEVQGIFKELSGMPLEGYEIHMGRTVSASDCKAAEAAETAEAAAETAAETAEAAENLSQAFLTTLREQQFGEVKADGFCGGSCYGTYVHGIFDADGVALTMVKALVKKKGLDPKLLDTGGLAYEVYRETQFDRLADELRKSLDMKAIYEILKRGLSE